MPDAPNGFWAQAQADPDRTVLIAPDGGEWSADRLHAECNKLVGGLRAAGLEAGDAFATVLPNGPEFLAAYLAAAQAGSTWCRSTTTSWDPRSPGSSPTPAPRRSSRTPASARPRAPRPTRRTCPGTAVTP